MNTPDKGTLDRIKALINEQAPDARIYLFGSRTRGNVRSESDWDLLILLNKEKVSPLEEAKIIGALYELEFEIGQIISPLVYSTKEWHSKYCVTPFYKNIMQEGKLI